MPAGNVTLEPLSEETLEFVRMVRSDPEVYRWLREKRPVATEEQRIWFGKYLEQSEHRIYVGVCSGRFFGYSQIQQQTSAHRVEIGVCVAPYAQGRGLGEKLLRATISEAWELGSNELRAYIFAGNVRSMRLFERCGFVLDEMLMEPQCLILRRED